MPIDDTRESYSRRDCRCGLSMAPVDTVTGPRWRCNGCRRTIR